METSILGTAERGGPSLPAGRAAACFAAGAVAVAGLLAAALFHSERLSGAQAIALSEALQVLGAGLFLTSGFIWLSISRLTGDIWSALMGGAWTLLGGIAFLKHTLVRLLIDPEAATAVEPLMRLTAMAVSVSLAAFALRARPSGGLSPGRTVTWVVLPALFLYVSMSLGVVMAPRALTLLADNQSEALFGSVIAAGWLVIAIRTRALGRQDHLLAARSWPLLGCLSVAAVMRAAGSEINELIVSAALLAALVGLAGASQSALDLHRTFGEAEMVASRAVADLDVAAREAEKLDRWTSALRHDASNSIAGMRMATEVLAGSSGGLSEAQRGLLLSTLAEIGHLEHLVTRPTEDDSRPDPVTFRVDEVLGTAVGSRRAAGATVSLHTVETTALGSPSDLVTVMQNLLINAERHGEGRDVSVSVREQGDHVEVSVVDRGPGIPDEMVARVFDRGVTTGEGGQGLGLDISRELLRAAGGDLILRRNRGGAEFVAILRAPARPQSECAHDLGGDRQTERDPAAVAVF